MSVRALADEPFPVRPVAGNMHRLFSFNRHSTLFTYARPTSTAMRPGRPLISYRYLSNTPHKGRPQATCEPCCLRLCAACRRAIAAIVLPELRHAAAIMRFHPFEQLGRGEGDR